jgi:hypothetical protein
MEQTERKKVGLHKPNNIIPIPFDEEIDFYKLWCIFLRPIVNLTNREIDVIAEFLRQRAELSKVISDPATLDTMLMTDTTKQKIINACHITQQHFYVVMNNLRKNKVIINGIINPKLIPNVREGDNGIFQLMILFKRNEQKGSHN